MTTRGPNLCFSCKHLDRSTLGYGETPKCSAFPRAIPAEIFAAGSDHRLPVEGQFNNDVYEMIPELSEFFDTWAAIVLGR